MDRINVYTLRRDWRENEPVSEMKWASAKRNNTNIIAIDAIEQQTDATDFHCLEWIFGHCVRRWIIECSLCAHRQIANKTIELQQNNKAI